MQCLSDSLTLFWSGETFHFIRLDFSILLTIWLLKLSYYLLTNNFKGFITTV